MANFKKRNPLRDIWAMMIRRCVDPSLKDWDIYGGRPGNPVTVCERWLSYQNFVEDMPPRPSMGHSIDRIDGTKGYEPGNVKWSTATEQARNMNTNIHFEHDGLKLTLAAWAEKIGMKYLTLYSRVVTRKMPFAEAIAAPVGLPKTKKGRVNSRSKIFTFDGKTMALVDWAAHLGINYGALKSRVSRGTPIEIALNPARIPHSKHKTSSNMLTFNGKTQPIIAWAEELGMSYVALKSRIDRGWDVATALTRPVGTSH